jgi:CheY-like chemotaxis protein
MNRRLLRTCDTQDYAEKRMAEPSGKTASAATVLVVEDQALVRLDVAQELQSAGYNVIEACDADEALAVLKAGTGVDVLLTDVSMPGSLGGVALARIVRRQLPRARIIVMSANRHDWEDGWRTRDS